MCFICTVLFLAGCTEQRASDKQIKNDITQYDEFAELNAEIKDYSIKTRRTSVDNKEDEIIVHIKSENNFCIFEHDFELCYELYDNGWVLYYIEETDFSYEVKESVKEIPDEIIQSDVNDFFQNEIAEYNLKNIIIKESSLIDSKMTGEYGAKPYMIFSVPCSAENDYAEFYTDCHLRYELNTDTGWEFIGTADDYNPEREVEVDITSEPGQALVEESLANAGYESYEFIEKGMPLEEYFSESTLYEYSYDWLENFTYSYTYNTTSKRYPYMTLRTPLTTIYTLDPSSGWYWFSSRNGKIDREINATGKWVYEDEQNRYEFNIISVDPEQVTYTIDLKMTEWIFAVGEKTYYVSSNGETKQKTWRSTDAAYYGLITDDCVAYIGREGDIETKYYYLEFRSYLDGEGESGFYFNDHLLTLVE